MFQVLKFNSTQPANFARNPELCIFARKSKNLHISNFCKVLAKTFANIDVCIFVRHPNTFLSVQKN